MIPVQFVTVGWSTRDESVRNIGWGIPQNGWYHSGIDKNLRGWASWFEERGYRYRLNLHNPWGTNAGQAMDFDQYLEARANPLLELACESFPLWLETRVKRYVDFGGECIIYLGTPRADEDMVAREKYPEDYYSRAMECLDAIPSWCSIGFDSVNEITKDHPAYSVLVEASRRHPKVYVEPRPTADSDVLQFGVIAANHTNWFRTNPERYPNVRPPMASNEQIQGERLVRPRVGDSKVRRQIYADIIAEGSTPLLYDISDLELIDEVAK